MTVADLPKPQPSCSKRSLHRSVTPSMADTGGQAEEASSSGRSEDAKPTVVLVIGMSCR